MTTAELTNKGFEFVEGTHKYYLDGKPLTGVTTVLNVIAKPMLIGWAARMATEYVRDNLKDLEELEAVLTEAVKAHARKKEDAGTKGTDIHAQLEELVKKAIAETDGKIPVETTSEDKQIAKFLTWAKEKNVQFLESEKKMYSPTHWLAGTCDFTAYVSGKKLVGDFKTMAKIWDRVPFFQTAAYRLMLEEMGEKDFEGSVIVNLPKNGAALEEAYSFDYDTDKEAFLAALKLYRVLNNY